MKADVLEQIVDDYLQHRGYFTQHNIRFRPRPDHPEFESSQDSNHSDIDVIGIDPRQSGLDRVFVVSCKSWQGGFNATSKLAELQGKKKNPKRETWKKLRELWIPKWSEAFLDTVTNRTGEAAFTYRIAVTKLSGDAEAWSKEPTILENLPGCSIGFLTLEEMWRDLVTNLGTTLAPSEIGRLVQVLKAADFADDTLALLGSESRRRRPS